MERTVARASTAETCETVLIRRPGSVISDSLPVPASSSLHTVDVDSSPVSQIFDGSGRESWKSMQVCLPVFTDELVLRSFRLNLLPKSNYKWPSWSKSNCAV